MLDLEKMTLSDLKVIAKENNIKKCLRHSQLP